ncbi:MAG: hypothetical protein PUC29_04165 [Clostridia bacterium]|nr:hypothetical protein [Clostridia bacterium]
MKNTNKKQQMLSILETMIQNAEKGPSGFWVDDHEGCGNPDIFPEFKEGLKRGSLVQKEHYLCPWNTAVLYGNGHGNINTGCYHSCSIRKAKYLSPEMVKAVLIRFKKLLQNGYYDNPQNLKPLLKENEINYIEKRIRREKQERDLKIKTEKAARLKKAAKLIDKYPNAKDILGAYYGKDEYGNSSEYGLIDFHPNGMKEVVGAEKFSYDDFLEVQFNSARKQRTGFINASNNITLGYKGCIERKTAKAVCFKRIWIEGMYSDGVCFDDKEEHVWMDIKGFESFNVGDSLAFAADVYRYVKKSNGKTIDYGLRNPVGITKIDPYILPSDKELMAQRIDSIICEACYLSEQCNKMTCILNKSVKRQRKEMLDVILQEYDPEKDLR